MSIFIFSRYFFFNRFCGVEKCGVTQHCLYRDSFNFKRLDWCRSSHRSFVKKVLLKISQYSQKNPCVGVFIKTRLQHRCLPVNIAKFLKNAYPRKHLQTATSLMSYFFYVRTFWFISQTIPTFIREIAAFFCYL